MSGPVNHPRYPVNPMTPAERQRLGEILDRLAELRDVLLAERGGRLFPDAADDLAGLRTRVEEPLDEPRGA